MLRHVFVMVALASGIGSAVAQQLVSTVGVRSTLVFTDNLFSTSTDKESGAVLQLLPYITGGNSGRRNRYRYFYGPSAIFYGGGHSNLNRVSQILQADATVALIDEYLALGFSARANQNLINPERLGERQGFDALGNPDAYAQTASFKVTPIITLPLVRSEYATLEIAPGINYSFTTDTASGDSNVGQTGTSSSVSLTSGEYFSRLPWRLVWRSNAWISDSSSNDVTNRYNDVTLTTSYRLSTDWTVNGLVGYDDNNYGNDTSLYNPNGNKGFRWRITPYWTPTSRTSIGVGYGKRYFGTDWYLNLRHRLKTTVLSLIYQSVITDARTVLLNEDVVSFEDAFGDPIVPGTGQDFTGTYTNPALVSDTFVNNKLQGVLAWRKGRNGISVTLSRNERKYQTSDVQYLDTYSTLRFSRRLTPLATGSLRLDYWRHEDLQVPTAPQQSDFTQYRLSLVWNYVLSDQTTTGIVYSYIDRSSEAGQYDYGENRLYLTLNWHL